jgi:Skp family chaperone for outer membrane proteins
MHGRSTAFAVFMGMALVALPVVGVASEALAQSYETRLATFRDQIRAMREFRSGCGAVQDLKREVDRTLQALEADSVRDRDRMLSELQAKSAEVEARIHADRGSSRARQIAEEWYAFWARHKSEWDEKAINRRLEKVKEGYWALQQDVDALRYEFC